jgi:hypothetical protein
MHDLTTFARRSHLETRGSTRDGAAAHHVACKDIHGSTAGIHRGTSHGDSELGSMNGPGAPTRRGAVVLQLEGQHTGRSRFPAARLDVAGPSQESIQGGREGEDGRGVLTTGRRCSHGRLEVVVHISAVDVPSGGIPSAPVPWSRTTLAPTARRLPSWRSLERPSVFSVRRGGGAPHSFLLFSPSPPRSAVEQRIGEKPKWSVVSPRGFGLGVKASVKAARGQSSHYATGLGTQAEVATWLAGSVRHRPFCITSRGKRGNPPCGPAPGWVGSGVTRLGMRASPPPVVPSCAPALVKAARPAAEVEKVRKKRVMQLTSGARASAKEKKEEGVARAGLRS